MRGLFVVLLIMVFLSLFSFMAMSVKSEYNDFKKSQSRFDFKTFTSAVCNYSGDEVKCKDELFVNCNGKVSKSSEIAECNGIKLEAQNVNGFAVFRKDWKDPRI